MVPSDATSATAEPEISANTMETPTLAMPRPPLTQPMIELTNSIRSSAIPARFITSPAIMNMGMARKTKLDSPENICMADTMLKGTTPVARNPIAVTPSATATGTPRTIKSDEGGKRLRSFEVLPLARKIAKANNLYHVVEADQEDRRRIPAGRAHVNQARETGMLASSVPISIAIDLVDAVVARDAEEQDGARIDEQAKQDPDRPAAPNRRRARRRCGSSGESRWAPPPA